MDSAPYRESLGWKDETNPSKVTELDGRLSKLETIANPPPATSQKKNNDPTNPDDPKKVDPKKPHWFTAFVISMFSFMPLNIGFLCIIAAYVGGCSVNKNEIDRLERLIADLRPDDHSQEAEHLRRKLSYLTENPLNSTIRGLVVYLILISGLFVLGGTPVSMGVNQVLDLTQYIRLAGMFSFFGYIAGNDPTVFFTLLNFVSSRFHSSQAENQKK